MALTTADVALELRGYARFEIGPVFDPDDALLLGEFDAEAIKSGSMMPSEGVDRDLLLRLRKLLSSACNSPGLYGTSERAVSAYRD